ncbi:MAG: HD domain-containing protein [Hyphomicrobiaceae bacterium]|nr:HD domain-containing protein [Hyphomicrobiaceae bacterium]
MVKLSHNGLDRSDSITQYLAIGSRVFRELIDTRAFKRLEKIRFLGGIDYLLVRSPNGVSGNTRYTRYQHSVGVARLALLYCDAIELCSKERDLLTAAALLHDIGHAPLSHSLEPVFLEEFGIEHHSATECIILGDSPLGGEIFEILRDNSISISRLIEILNGNDSSFGLFMNGPINFDTIEGILRSLNYFFPSSKFPSSDAVLKSAIDRRDETDEDVVDRFWRAKDYVYNHLINSDAGILADYVCMASLRNNLKYAPIENRICRDDYFSTEPVMFKKLDDLHDRLTNPDFYDLISLDISTPITYKKRRFFVEREADFFSREDFRRYQQTKEFLEFSPKSQMTSEIEQDLFDGSHRKGSQTI